MWEIEYAYMTAEHVHERDRLLADGWEPFAVTREENAAGDLIDCVWFRKFTPKT